MLGKGFGRDALIHGDPRRHENSNTMVRELRNDFMNWLGESKCMHGLKTIPPSRFPHANANGLWEYSPFLCGAGLVRAQSIHSDEYRAEDTYLFYSTLLYSTEQARKETPLS